MPSSRLSLALVALNLIQIIPLFSGFANAAPAATPKIGDLFEVATGIPGNCDKFKDVIQQWFDDSLTLAQTAIDGLQAEDADSKSYVDTYFSIKPDDAANKKKALAAVQAVQTKMTRQLRAVDGRKKPVLFCDSSWLQEQKLTEVAFDPKTGKPRTDKKTVRDILPKSIVPLPTESAFWSDKLRQYNIFDSGDYCKDPKTFAGTVDSWSPPTMTLCVANIQKKFKTVLLTDIKTPNERQFVQTFQTQALTLYHELFHLSLGNKGTPDHSYDPKGITQLNTAEALENPETYTLYSLAKFLGTQNTGLTFATGKAAKLAVAGSSGTTP